MRCPEDQSPLSTVEVLGRQLSSCSRCHGLWAEVAELEAILRASGGPAPGAFEPDGGRGGPCPVCGQPLESGLFPGNGLQAERCPTDQSVWLAPGRLTRLLARREPAPAARAAAPRPRRPVSWRGLVLLLLFFGLGWGVMEALWPRLGTYLEERRHQQRARQAWEVRRGPELRGALEGLNDTWLQARERFLAGDFPAAWKDVEGDDDLREDIELSLLFDVPWPRRVVGWLRSEHLVRVVEPGVGDLPRDLAVEVVAPSGQLFEPEWKEPDGSPAEDPEPFLKVTRLEEAELTQKDAQDVRIEGLTEKGQLLIALIGWEGRLVGYCFPSSKPARLPKPGQLEIDGERWIWREGKFVQGEP